jgi:hypothetical protein
MTPYHKSRWGSLDKILHFIGGFFVAAHFGLLGLIIVSFGKEVYDEYDYGGFDIKDAIATLVGGLIFLLLQLA